MNFLTKTSVYLAKPSSGRAIIKFRQSKTDKIIVIVTEADNANIPDFIDLMKRQQVKSNKTLQKDITEYIENVFFDLELEDFSDDMKKEYARIKDSEIIEEEYIDFSGRDF